MLSFSQTEAILDVTCFSYSPEGKLKTWTDYVFTHFYCRCGSNTLWIPKFSLILKPYVQSCRDIGNIGKKKYSIHILILFLYSFFLQWQSHCYTVIPSCQLFLIKYFTKPSGRHLGLNVGQKSVVFPSSFDFCSFLFFLFIGDLQLLDSLIHLCSFSVWEIKACLHTFYEIKTRPRYLPVCDGA